ncbi:hypothetical protein BH23ACT11_BH23ACT11_05370 [soil metagenome]
MEMRIVAYRPFAVILMAIIVGVIALFAYGSSATAAVNVKSGFTNSQISAGLDRPTAMTFAPGGRILVAEQGGKLRVIKNGRWRKAPFVRVRTDSSGERGLLGVTIDPNFSKNRYVYIYQTVQATSSRRAFNRVVRFTASKANPNRRARGSAKVIFKLNYLSSKKNHNGGALHFRGGKLFIAVGDNANQDNAQSLRNLKGKMLRINKNGTIPKNNPFYGKARGKNKAIWARGFRNPFSFAVQPGTGKTYINDVGQKTWEEINRGRAGANYGWPRYEGPERNRRYAGPIFAYRHGTTNTTGCAITGGDFYNPRKSAPRKFPARFRGDYFFADVCSGWIRRYDPKSDRATGFATGIAGPVDLRTGPDGSLYYLARGAGAVGKIRYVGG